MTLFLLILIIAIISYFALNIYRHDNTAFYKLTGYSYIDVLTNNKIRTTYNLVNALSYAKGPHKVLVNVQVPLDETLEEIDIVLLHESGIYAMNVKGMTGWVNGREQDIEWTQLLHKNKTHLFNNPIHNGKRLVHALQGQLPEIDEKLFETVVIFTNGCSFQNIEVHSENVDVIKAKELKKWAGSLQGKNLSETEIQTLYAALKGAMNVKNSKLKLKDSMVSTN